MAFSDEAREKRKLDALGKILRDVALIIAVASRHDLRRRALIEHIRCRVDERALKVIIAVHVRADAQEIDRHVRGNADGVLNVKVL